MENNKQKLREKLRKKKESRSLPKQEANPFDGQTDILQMMDSVNKILKTNPQMVQQISKCVSNVMNNQDLMKTLTGQLEKEIQTFESNSDGESLDASEKQSTQ